MPSKKTLEYKKNDPYRNLLVAAINRLVEEKHISLNLEEVNEKEENGYIFLKLFEYNSVIIWRNIGYGELTISVWWKYNHDEHPQANLEGNYRESFSLPHPLAKRSYYSKFVGVTASCWLERRTSKYIQGKNRESIHDIYTRKGELNNLKELPIQKPKGYKISGPFIL